MNETSMSQSAVRVLHLEDNEHDHLLVREILEHEGFHFQFELAKSREQFEDALNQETFDLIISDFTLPSYDGSLALAAARRLQKDVPFIFFSATIGEEVAVESLKIGATDFVIKQRPKRLVSAVRRALHEAVESRHRKEMEKTLRETEERFRLLARATDDVIWERDLKTNKVWSSDNFHAVFGHDPRVVGSAPEAWEALLHPEDRPRVLASVAGMIAGGGHVWWSEFRLRRADGTYAQVFSRAFVVYDEEHQPIRLVGATIDITEHKRAKEKIQEQAALLDKAGDAIIVCDLENRVGFWNRSAEKIYGWKASEAIGQKIEDLLFRETPEDLNTVERQLLERDEWFGEIRQTTREGKQITVASRWTLVRDEQSEPKSKLIFNTDVTEVKNLENQLLRVQRMESLGALVGGIAHDINNALVPVLMGVGFLKTLPLPQQAVSIVDAMRASAMRGAEMVKSVLAFARGSEDKKNLVYPDRLLKEMCRIINDTFSKAIQCHTEIEKNSWAIFGSATQLHQVLMNLCVNARDAMPQGGTIKLSTKNVILDDAVLANHPEIKPGKYLCLSVVDTGVGIPKETLAHIFEPFFTTKPSGKGTGLGLSTSQTIVKNHGGFMEVISSPGQGSEFKVFLPVAESGEAISETNGTTLSLPVGRGETILVVDDEIAILAIVKTALENYGYRVVTAAGGTEAVAKLTKARDSIQLVLCDVGMPLLDGTATLTALKKIKSDLKAIVISGIERETTGEARDQADAFLSKPFTVEKLVKVVHETLAKTGRVA